MKPTRNTPSKNEATTDPMAVVGTEIEMAPDFVPVASGTVLPLPEPVEPALPVPVAVALAYS